MSSLSQTPATSDRFKSILDTALKEYEDKTGKDLLDWSAKELQTCDTVEAVLDKIEHLAEAFDKSRGNKKLMKWIGSSIHVLYTISATLGEGVGMVHPSAKVVFAGIGVLLAAAKDVWDSHDALVDLFERVHFFLKRLGVHTQTSLTEDMVGILVKIMAEVISILSIATKEMQQSRTKIYLKKLVGRTDIEDALKRLDNLTQEEVRMAIAQVLKAMSGLKDDSKKANEVMQRIADDVGKIKDNLDEMKWNQIEQEIRKWFSPPDPSVNYNIAQEAHQEGTAAWLFKSEIFKEWKLVGPLLWIHGKPGSGKSVLCSVIIKHVISLRDAGHASLAYFFFDFRDKEKKQDVRNFLTSLLIQLSARSDRCRKIISHIYSTHGDGTEQPSISTLTKCLHEMLFVEAQQPIYIIIDALDECPNISGLPTQQSVLLDLLEDIVNLRIPNLHICVTSRLEVDIQIVLEPLAYGVVSLNDEDGQKKDISDYVNAVVKNIRGWRDADRKLVVEVLSEKADGMFRWVFCQLEVLRRCLPALIRQTLDRLPKTLDVTYANMLGQIPEENQAHAHRMLLCLMVAVRPLRVEELAEVLAFDFDSTQDAIPKYRADWRPSDQVYAVQSTCSSLIAIVNENGTRVVQFSHFSVKEFLMSDRLTSSHGDFSQYRIFPRLAHTTLARACLGSLLSDDYTDEESNKSLPLEEYAVIHWVAHAQFEDVASSVKDGMETLFDCDKPHFAAWVRRYNIEWQPAWEKTPTPLYYSSRLGLPELVEHLAIKHPQHVNTIGGGYEFPLRAALAGKFFGVVEILLKHGVDINVQGRGKRTALHEEIADVSVVRFLLSKGADVNCRQVDLWTPLHLVAWDGELEVARVLLEHKADVNSRNNEGNTPLHLVGQRKYFSQKDGVDIARVLLEHGADVNAQETENNRCTPLHEAAFNGRLKIVQVLLEYGANTNAENNWGETPLHIVTRGKYGSEEQGVGIVRLLLEHGVDVNAQAIDKVTPLHLAALDGRLKIVEVLLEHGANMNAVNMGGETPLHRVTRGKFVSEEKGVGIVRLLLEHGVDVNAQEKDKCTPLHEAAFNGRLEVAQVLLEHGANVNAVNEWGSTPLHLVARGKYYSQKAGVGVARMLLEHGVNVNAQENNKCTPLHEAAFNGRPEIAQVLLENGANTNAVNEWGETSLHRAIRGEYGSEEQGVGIVRVLLEHGVDVNAQDNYKCTPLHDAAFSGRPEVAQVLLEHGANMNAVNEHGYTPLHLVARGKYYSQKAGVGVARMFLERGMNVNAQENNKCTPLHEAAFNEKLEVAQVLLEYGANTNAVNNWGETPLHRVIRSEYGSEEQGVDIVRLLLEHGVDVNAQENNKCTPLHEAVFNGRLRIVQKLLEYGANAITVNKWGETPLYIVTRGRYAFEEQGVGIVRLLLEHGVDVYAQENNKCTPLHEAVFNGRLKIVQVLLEYGANANTVNKWGETPLHIVTRGRYAFEEQGVGIVQLLLEHGVDVNAQAIDKLTPLHLAALNGRLKIVQVLLEHGAKISAENQQGETPLHLLTQGEYDSQKDGVGIARMLLGRGVNVNAPDKDQNTPLHMAALNRRLEIARVLLDYGANASSENDQKQTPLHLVSQAGYCFQDDDLDVAKLLLERSADMNAQDKDSATPLHLACCRGRIDIARVLLDYDAKAQAENN